jgi:maleylpyruvate isomerase
VTNDDLPGTVGALDQDKLDVTGMNLEPSADELRRLLGEIDCSTGRLLTDVAELDSHQLGAPSLLGGWTRVSVAAHLAHVALAYQQMTEDALSGRPTTTYPGGAAERDRSLHSFDFLPPAGVVKQLRDASSGLGAMWRELGTEQWRARLHEDRIGPMTLGRLVAMRLTELEVHHVDLGTGYTVHSWPVAFVVPCLGLRVAWLDAHHRRRPDADPDIKGRWLLQTTDSNQRWLIESSGSRAHSSAAGPAVPADAVLSGRAVDLLAFLLGRMALSHLEVTGDTHLAGAFKRAFPGP